MSLYTKYRPRDWDSVVGQDAIASILRTSLTQDRVGHAYILTGSRGTGKTTTARILAKGVNCLNLQNGNPCHECAHCLAFDAGNMLDCIEIDGASNNGVENVRDLIEKARFAPNQGKYKVYIIDEVHMLSTGAFNALLKTLEEPPDHVKFILATTEIEKVPETIRSRSLRFDFRKISIPDIVTRLKYVTLTEGIQADEEALEIIARAARGALRDALTLTEQNTINNAISTEYVRSTLSLIEESLLESIVDIIIQRDYQAMISLLDTLRSRHIEVRGLFDQILYRLRDMMLNDLSQTGSKQFALYSEIFHIFEEAYGRIRTIGDGTLLMEITLLRAVARELSTENTPPARETVIKPPAHISSSPAPVQKPSQKEVIAPTSSAQTPSPEQPLSVPEKREDKKQEETTPISQSSFSYIRLLEEIKKTKATLVLDLKTARFELSEKKITFLFPKEWHYNRINNTSAKNIILEQLENLYGSGWSLECRLDANTGIHIVDEVF